MIKLLGNAGQFGLSPGTLQTRKCDANLTSVNCKAGVLLAFFRGGQGARDSSLAPDRPAGTGQRPLLAQLDRAPGFEPGGWGFKSLRAGQLVDEFTRVSDPVDAAVVAPGRRHDAEMLQFVERRCFRLPIGSERPVQIRSR